MLNRKNRKWMITVDKWTNKSFTWKQRSDFNELCIWAIFHPVLLLFLSTCNPATQYFFSSPNPSCSQDTKLFINLSIHIFPISYGMIAADHSGAASRFEGFNPVASVSSGHSWGDGVCCLKKQQSRSHQWWKWQSWQSKPGSHAHWQVTNDVTAFTKRPNSSHSANEVALYAH